MDRAQKCGGVQKNIIKNNAIAGIPISFVIAAHPTTGGTAPAAPPITIF